MIKQITTMELQCGTNYSIYMRQGGAPNQLVCRVESRRAQNDVTKFVQQLANKGLTTSRDHEARRACANAILLCDHSACFAVETTSLEKTLLGIWHVAKALSKSPMAVQIHMKGRVNPVFYWTPTLLSYLFAHQRPEDYVPGLRRLVVFESLEMRTDSDYLDLKIAPGIALEHALQEAHKVLTDY